jgi:hypothetical protein
MVDGRRLAVDFYDSTKPALMPAGSAVLVYWDGRYAVSPSDLILKRFSAVRWITVLGDWENAGAVDYEAGNHVYSAPGALRTYVQGRASRQLRARVYHNRSDTSRVLAELFGLEGHYEHWVATLDGNKLSASYLPNMWGVQFAGGVTSNYDTSILYGAW